MQVAHELAAKINAHYPLQKDKKIIKIINGLVKKLNGKLGKIEKIKRFKIVLKDLISLENYESSIERRKNVEINCSEIIESMYLELEEENK